MSVDPRRLLNRVLQHAADHFDEANLEEGAEDLACALLIACDLIQLTAGKGSDVAVAVDHARDLLAKVTCDALIKGARP